MTGPGTDSGRRRPYFTVGAVLASLALIVMPNSAVLWFAVGMLWILDASINITMEPFRAFVGDMLPERQRTAAFSMQTFFIGIGAVLGSALPWIMANLFGVANTAAEGEIPQSLHYAFYVGGLIFLVAVMWTVFTTPEYSPEELAEFEAARPAVHTADDTTLRSAEKYRNGGIVWALLGAIGWFLIANYGLDKQLFILAGMFIAFGVLQLVVSMMQNAGHTRNGVYEVVHDLFHMPKVMQQLAVVQFFTWFGLFAMWVFGTPAVTSHHYGTSDPTTLTYATGADWLGLLFGAYNGIAALAAIAIPFVAAKFGCRWTHLANLTIGGLCLISFYFISDPKMLVVPMVGIGIAWASILSLPYALLSSNLPGHKMGIYMGIFNILHRDPAGDGCGCPRAGTQVLLRRAGDLRLRHGGRVDGRCGCGHAAGGQERRAAIKNKRGQSPFCASGCSPYQGRSRKRALTPFIWRRRIRGRRVSAPSTWTRPVRP